MIFKLFQCKILVGWLVCSRFEGFEPELLAVKVGSILDIDDVLELSVKNAENKGN